jgi:hypothetical protein
MLDDNLLARNLSVEETIYERQQTFHMANETEWTYRRLLEATTHHNEHKDLCVLNLMECVPCILHMENNCGLKVLQMLLGEGLKNAAKERTFVNCGTKKQRIEAYVDKVEEISNQKVLGNENYPACWHVPYNPSNSELNSITMDNPRTRKLINNLRDLVFVCIKNDTRQRNFLSCRHYYNKLMEILRKRTDFNDEEIDEFQKNADYFYIKWIDLYEEEGLRNYIHMIGSGHVADFLAYYCNLYIHSQQGWEHFLY